MATSGSYAFDPTTASTLDEALERAGMDPATVQHRHLMSALQSMNYALRDLEAEDLGSFARQDTETAVTVASTATITPASGTIDVLTMTITVNSADIPLSRMPRNDYAYMANKTQEGQPSQFWVNYESLSPVITLWPVPDAVYSLKYDRLRSSQSVTALSETLDVQRMWMDAFCYGTAARLAEKYNVSRYDHNIARYRETVEKAKQTKIGRGPVVISFRGFGTSRTRRR